MGVLPCISLSGSPFSQQRREEKVGNVNTEDPPAEGLHGTVGDSRRRPRFSFEIDVTINSPTRGLLKGRSVDISESGIAAMLKIEVPLGEFVELSFELAGIPITIRALVRQKNAFRYGFEFVDSASAHELLRRTCRDLAVDQSLKWPA
jgi:hypothetical protein